MTEQTEHIGDTNKMMTAVEWLIEKQLDAGYGLAKEWREQAKAMEKEQIKNAYLNGTTDMEKEDALLMGEDYFNEYYKK
jgi:hypothetical protein